MSKPEIANKPGGGYFDSAALQREASPYRWHQRGNMKQAIPKRSNRFYDTSRFEYAQIRVYHKAARGKHSPRYLLKCGDCDQKLEIHYGEDGLEIGGVHGSIEDWREILLPLLLIEEKNGRLIKHKPTSAKETRT